MNENVNLMKSAPAADASTEDEDEENHPQILNFLIKLNEFIFNSIKLWNISNNPQHFSALSRANSELNFI